MPKPSPIAVATFEDGRIVSKRSSSKSSSSIFPPSTNPKDDDGRIQMRVASGSISSTSVCIWLSRTARVRGSRCLECQRSGPPRLKTLSNYKFSGGNLLVRGSAWEDGWNLRRWTCTILSLPLPALVLGRIVPCIESRDVEVERMMGEGGLLSNKPLTGLRSRLPERWRREEELGGTGGSGLIGQWRHRLRMWKSIVDRFGRWRGRHGCIARPFSWVARETSVGRGPDKTVEVMIFSLNAFKCSRQTPQIFLLSPEGDKSIMPS
ncbi:hypothetical protein DL96DRAFT_15975 [Flagelloscypha sp. PMI_526]|nr:hypothetical protein DL96DRAFT_15975 [Flagelloscypha sp. PMI_526]